MTTPLTGCSYIGETQPHNQETIGETRHAATGEVLLPVYQAASEQDVDQAVKLANSAFRAYAALKPTRRAEFLRGIATAIEAIGEPLVERATAETGLPAARIQAETTRTCHQLRLFADLITEGHWVEARIETAQPQRTPLPKPDLRSMLRPLGPVAVFCAANFPLAYSVAGGDTASALAAGCPVIVNAHHGHPGTSELIAQAILHAARTTHMPEGVFSLLYGRGISVGQALVKHPGLRAVGFTGSRAGGRALMDAVAARPQPIPIYAEMSSLNPVFIMPEALRQRWGDLATGLHQSFTLGLGQFCTKPGLVFLTAGKEADHFVEKLKGLTASTAAGTMLNSQIRENFRHKRDRLIGIPSVGIVSEGEGAQAGLFMTTASTFLENGLLHEEVFGPVTLLVLCRHTTDLINCAEALEGQLTATIHSDADDWAAAQTLRFILQEKAGRLIHNGFPTGLEVSHATVHGGPYPATSDGRSTSVGSAAITRWTRSICYQNFPDSALPPELKNDNPLKILRLVDGQWQTT